MPRQVRCGLCWISDTYWLLCGCVPFGESKNRFLIGDSADFTSERNAKSEKSFVTLATSQMRSKYLCQNNWCVFSFLTKTAMKLWKHDFIVNWNSENNVLELIAQPQRKRQAKVFDLWQTVRFDHVYKWVCKAIAVNFCHRGSKFFWCRWDQPGGM